jgi:multiple sugar transport system substrate-binding protein
VTDQPEGTTFMKRQLSFLTATVILVAAAACGDDDGPDNTATDNGGDQAAGETVTLQFWAWVPGLDEVVAQWNSEHPDIQVEVSEVPAGDGGGYQKMRAALEAGNPPDLAQIEYEQLSGFLLSDGLEELSQYGADDYADRFVEWQWQQGVYGDEVYAIPQASGPMAMFYRKDLFDQWGIEVPTTWEEYEQAARQVRQHDAYLANFSPSSSGWFTGLAWQAGGRWFGTEGDSWTVDMDNDATRQVTDYWQGMIDDGLVKTVPESSNTWYRDLQEGEVVSWVSAAWGDAILEENAPDTSGKWRVAPMPQWDPDSPAAGNFGGSSTAILKGSDHPEEALEFAVWLNSDPEAVDLLVQGGAGWPAATDGSEVPSLQQPSPFFGGQVTSDVFAEADRMVDTDWVWIPTWGQTAEHLVDGFKTAMSGDSTLTDAVASAEEQTLQDLEDAGLPTSGG